MAVKIELIVNAIISFFIELFLFLNVDVTGPLLTWASDFVSKSGLDPAMQFLFQVFLIYLGIFATLEAIVNIVKPLLRIGF